MAKKNLPHSRPSTKPALPKGGAAPAAAQTALPLGDDAAAKAALDFVADAVQRALALAWAPKGRSQLLRYLHCLEFRHPRGALITHGELNAALEWLKREGNIQIGDQGITLREPLRSVLGAEMLLDERIGQWRAAVFTAENFMQHKHWGSIYFNSLSQATTIARLLLYGGTVEEWQNIVGNNSSRYASDAYMELVNAPLDEKLWVCVREPLRDAMLADIFSQHTARWDKSGLQYIDWTIRRLDADPRGVADPVRYQLVEILVLRGDAARAELFLANDDSAFADVLRAATLATLGEWPRAVAAIEAVEKPLKAITNLRKHYMSANIAWLYPLCLIAMGGPQRLAQALRFCLSEQGKRQPEWDGLWGAWSMVLTMRLGDAPPDYDNLRAFDSANTRIGIPAVQRYLLRAWVGRPSYSRDALALLDARIKVLDEVGCHYLSTLLQSCRKLAQSEAPLPGFFVAAPTEQWREALASIIALDGTTPVATTSRRTSALDANRLVWDVSVAKSGKILGIQPWRQNRNARGDGWNKPARVGLAPLAKSEKLDSADAGMARHIREARYGNNSYVDLGAAGAALIGHPRLVVNGDYAHLVRVIEGQPALEVVADEKNGCWKFNLQPVPPALARAERSNGEKKRDHPLTREMADEFGPDDEFDDDDGDEDAPYYRDNGDSDKRAQEQRNKLQCLVINGPDAATLVRFSPAHMRVAQIIANELKVPLTAKTELAAAMQVLATHFELRSETTLGDAARMLPAPSQLRAEVSPIPGGIALRLVVAPFDSASAVASAAVAPARFAAGVGRKRVVMKIGNDTVGVERDLGNERTLREQVIQALDNAGVAWEEEHDRVVTRDPESSLNLLEVVEIAPAVAGIDWPKGKPITVTPVGAKQAKFELATRKDWFSAEATVQVDENQVMRLAELLPLLAKNPSRFLQLAPDRYLALTAQLRRQLDDLAALADFSGASGKAAKSDAPNGGIRVGDAGAMWLLQELDDWVSDADTATTKRIASLRAAFSATPEIPAGLHATLRDYQIDGVRWLQRLGMAGFGACLADDMGLGKTVQALALLLDRATGGPALVIAPTSLIGNWAIEAERFAPGMRCRIYGETNDENERRNIVESAAAGEIVLCTYSLMQMAKELFAAKVWHTIVLDEAQAVKNSLAQRTQAVFALQGRFRIALSGTPVENRLEELWSIMRFLNPGLLGTSEQFARRFVAPIAREQLAGAASNATSATSASRAPGVAGHPTLRRLKRLIAPFLLRRTKAAVLTDLPERTEITLRADLDDEERSHYELLRRRAEAAIQQASGPDNTQRFKVLAELMRLRRAACDPRLVHNDWPAPGAKLRLFSHVAQDLAAGGHRTLVFSQFTDYLALLQNELDRQGFDYQYLDGATLPTERTRRVAAFQEGKGQFFLISLKAGGYGLNLTAADYVIIADPWWNPAAEDQAMGRAHRIGQRRPVTAYRLVAANTIEDRIVALHASKRALADGLLDGGDQAGNVASIDDLLALLRSDHDAD